MKYEATWTGSDGRVYEGSVTWANKNEWFFRGLNKEYGNSTGIDIDYRQSNQVPQTNGVGWAQRICGLTVLDPDVARASGIRPLSDWGESHKMHREGGSRRHKSKQRKSRKSNKSKKRKSRKAIRRRR